VQLLLARFGWCPSLQDEGSLSLAGARDGPLREEIHWHAGVAPWQRETWLRGHAPVFTGVVNRAKKSWREAAGGTSRAGVELSWAVKPACTMKGLETNANLRVVPAVTAPGTMLPTFSFLSRSVAAAQLRKAMPQSADRAQTQSVDRSNSRLQGGNNDNASPVRFLVQLAAEESRQRQTNWMTGAAPSRESTRPMKFNIRPIPKRM
jgi:hypothetical protein